MGEAKKHEGPGQYTELIGGGASAYHCILVTIKSKGEPIAITRIAASYADDDHLTEQLTGRLLVLRERMVKEDDLLDPAGIDTGIGNPNLLTAINQYKRTKQMEEFIPPGQAIIVPKGETYQVMLTSAFSPGEGPIPGVPGEKRASLLVVTQTAPGKFGPYESY